MIWQLSITLTLQYCGGGGGTNPSSRCLSNRNRNRNQSVSFHDTGSCVKLNNLTVGFHSYHTCCRVLHITALSHGESRPIQAVRLHKAKHADAIHVNVAFLRLYQDLLCRVELLGTAVLYRAVLPNGVPTIPTLLPTQKNKAQRLASPGARESLASSSLVGSACSQPSLDATNAISCKPAFEFVKSVTSSPERE
jgi:hypothetical protein